MPRNPLLRHRQPWKLPKKPAFKKAEQASIIKRVFSASSLKSHFVTIAQGSKKRMHLIIVVVLYIYFFMSDALNLITALSLGFVSLVLSDHLLEILLNYKQVIKEKFFQSKDQDHSSRPGNVALQKLNLNRPKGRSKHLAQRFSKSMGKFTLGK